MACLIFPSLCTILYNIALWARAPNLPFAQVPICMNDSLGIKLRTSPKVRIFVNSYYGSFNLGICHITCAWKSHGYVCPNIGVLAISSTSGVLQGPKG